MKKEQIIIRNARVITPAEVIEPGAVIFENGVITYTGPEVPCVAGSIIDAMGGYVLPGLVDLHSDAIEKELEPRPGAFFHIEMAFQELEKKLAGHGITTMYHSFSFAGAEWGVRGDKLAADIVRYIVDQSRQCSLIDNRIHLRYEVTNTRGLKFAKALLEEGVIDLMSFMDHTPGQGQYPTEEDYMRYIEKTYHLSSADARALIEGKKKKRGQIGAVVEELSTAARLHGLCMASHDDDSPEQVEYYRRQGVTINEFPINLLTAKAARDIGNYVSVGAPNILRGGSTGKAMRAMDAVVAGYANVLCSDYYPPSMLHAAFRLNQEGLGLPQAVRLVTIEPAKAAGLFNIGALEPGYRADIIIVHLSADVPVVTHTFVDGIQVYGVNYRRITA